MFDSIPLDRLPCISMIAYTGRKMKVGGISLPIVVDLCGLEIPKQNLAFLLNHDCRKSSASPRKLRSCIMP